jgi:hypothetical protein
MALRTTNTLLWLNYNKNAPKSHPAGMNDAPILATIACSLWNNTGQPCVFSFEI